jgi:elongation factor P
VIKAFDLKKGKVIHFQGDLWRVEDVSIMSKGNWRSYMQVRLKNVKTGRGTETRFSTDDKIETPFVETRPYEYLYREGEDYVLMDQCTFDQIHVSSEVMGEAHLYLKGNEVVTLQIIDGKTVSCELPNTVELTVTDTPPVVKGATATNQTKDAVIDTRTGEYLERAK